MAETKTVVVRRGSPRDAARLKEIAIAAKAHWGYGIHRVRAWAEDGEFTPEELGRVELIVAETEGRFREAAVHARARGAVAMEWEAEPNALGLYGKFGARHVRDGTSEWGRTLPIMRVELDA